MHCPSTADGLAALESRYRRDLQRLALPARNWTPAVERDGLAVLDVAIIGAGMAGLALATALKHLGMRAENFDRAPLDFEGPWATTARMQTLRSPKELTGPALGFASLTFRAWFEAQWGEAAWAGIEKISRLQWMDYLRWYRRVTGVTVHNRHRVTAVRPRDDGIVQIDVVDEAQAAASSDVAAGDAAGDVRSGDRPDGTRHRTVLARHVVLATGRDGLGGPWIPDWAHAIPPRYRAHSSDPWPDDRFAGMDVAVVGGGSSAMDVAATALEHGARSAHLLIRRTELPTINKGKGAGNAGSAPGYQKLPDAWKWRFRRYIAQQQVPPPHGSTLRVSRHANAFFHLGTAIDAVTVRDDGRLRIDTTRGPLAADFIVFCTGFRPDWAQRPEFAPFAAHVQVWGDRFVPADGDVDAELAASPDLGPLFEFQPKQPGTCPGLERIHCFCYPATLSMGSVSGDIPQISDGARQLAVELAGALYAEDIEAHYAAMQRYAEPELDGTEWRDSPLPPYDAGPPA